MNHTYNFSEGWCYTNCTLCDNDVLCNEYVREDGLVVWLCKKCEDKNHL
jgi:ribosomal protein L24E